MLEAMKKKVSERVTNAKEGFLTVFCKSLITRSEPAMKKKVRKTKVAAEVGSIAPPGTQICDIS